MAPLTNSHLINFDLNLILPQSYKSKEGKIRKSQTPLKTWGTWVYIINLYKRDYYRFKRVPMPS